MSIPNLISLARLLAVPLVVYLILKSAYDWAFWVFFAAGVSDAVDGYNAKRMGQEPELGAVVDPLADKALLVGVFITLGVQGLADTLIVVLVVFRDLMIVGGVLLLSIYRDGPRMHPVLVSKCNTAAQILFAVIVLAQSGLGFEGGQIEPAVRYLVIATTILSGGWYLVVWWRQMANIEDPK